MEHPRPQPHASYTLTFLLLIAAISQIVGEVLRPIGSEDQEQKISISSENPTRIHLLQVSKFLTWTPKNASAFLPKLFRPAAEIEEQQLIVEEIDDDLLINDLANDDGFEEEIGNYSQEFLANNMLLEGEIQFISDNEQEELFEKETTIPEAKQEKHKPKDFPIVSDQNRVQVHQNKTKKNVGVQAEQAIAVVTKSQASPSKKTEQSQQKEVSKAKKLAKSLSSDDHVQPASNPKLISIKKHNKSYSSFAQSQDSSPSKETSKPQQNSQKKQGALLASNLSSKQRPRLGLKNSNKEKKSTRPEAKKKKRKRRRYTKSGILIHGIDDQSSALKSFYQKLSTIKSSGKKIKIAHYGDSLIAGDYVTRTVRRLLQKTFGDAGHGFFLSGKGSRWYGRRWIELKSKGKWVKKRFSKAKKQGEEFGLGGVSFTSSSEGDWVRAKTTGIRLGSKVDFFELHYLVRPNGGSFTIDFAGEHVEVSTAAEKEQVKLLKLKAPKSGRWSAKVTTNGDGKVTLYGFTFERNQAGIVYDSLGLEGARAKLLLKLTTNEWVKQIRKRNPDLYILHYGTNESVNTKMSIDKYKQGLKQVIERFKYALPQSACLLVSPMDRGKKDEETGKIQSMRIVSKIVQAQREVSASEGCAFWSTYDAMGGRGSMARWYNASPKLASGDLTHPTSSGANRIGALFFAALMDAYKNR